jgi:hypothetical protein
MQSVTFEVLQMHKVWFRASAALASYDTQNNAHIMRNVQIVS